MSGENISSAEAEVACQRFSELTGTDSALALMFLQERNWDLQRAVDDFFEISKPSECPPKSCGERAADASQSEPRDTRLRIMSWNIDGLDSRNLESRTQAVIDVILRNKPHVVFLQEVVATSQSILEDGCHGYQMISSRSGHGKEDYYTAVLVAVEAVQLQNSAVTPFRSSQMGRCLHKVELRIGSLALVCINTHLESTRDGAPERRRQLDEALAMVSSEAPEKNVLFGGDLNLRDSEVPKLQGSVCDVWQATGSRKEAAYTWDTSRNDNLQVSYRSRLRFDRLYFRAAQKMLATQTGVLRPEYFELVGLERVPACRRFPSDHWGVLAHFQMT